MFSSQYHHVRSFQAGFKDFFGGETDVAAFQKHYTPKTNSSHLKMDPLEAWRFQTWKASIFRWRSHGEVSGRDRLPFHRRLQRMHPLVRCLPSCQLDTCNALVAHGFENNGHLRWAPVTSCKML